MKFLPKKEEVAVVTAILASDEYDSPEQMARAVVKSVALELAKRETFAVAHRDAPYSFYWPFFYEGDARRFHSSLGALSGTKAYLLPMRSPLNDLEAKERSNS
jgi:hypothetical protein